VDSALGTFHSDRQPEILCTITTQSCHHLGEVICACCTQLLAPFTLTSLDRAKCGSLFSSC